ncbi:ESCRT II complex subunit Dot2 [Thecaphora frezii]
MRKGPGLAALDRSLHSSQQYSSLGSELTSSQIASLRSQLDHFGASLRHFATQHRQEILASPEFRHAFQKMCSSIGVDPLASPIPSSSRTGPGAKVAGLWNDLLGLADWQYELGVQIIDVCVSTRHLNGGLIALDELIARVTRLRTGNDPTPPPSGSAKAKTPVGGAKAYAISEDDVVRSIKTLAPLGCGYEIIQVGPQKMVRSVPRQLGTDTMTVLAILSLPPADASSDAAAVGANAWTVERDAVGLPFVTQESLMPPRTAPPPGVGAAAKSAWTSERARAVLDDMLLREGMLWVDHQAYPPRYYSLSIGTETVR